MSEISNQSDAIFSTTRIAVRPENRKELWQTIASLLKPMKLVAGCLNYRFYQDATDENSFILVGEWRSEADWNAYLETDDFAVLLGTISVLSSRADTEFTLLAPVTDRDLLKKLQR
jgi:quinol monooxygenase YgiN